jgi:dihydroneopterin aldolase
VSVKVIKTVERSRYTLLEKLASKLLAGIMSDRRVQAAHVRVEKPQAVAQARSVAFELSAER